MNDFIISKHIDSIAVIWKNHSLPTFVIGIILATACAWWFYKGTVPPVTGWVRWLVISLRGLLLTFIILALCEPVVHVVRTLSRYAPIVVLLDTSSSIDLKGDPARKRDALTTFSRVKDTLDNWGRYFSFDDHTTALTTEPLFTGNATDILSSLRNASEVKDVSAIILISDGRWNLGEDPAGQHLPLNVPIHTVTVGSAREITDIVLSKVSVEPIGHEGKMHPVELWVSATKTIPNPISVTIEEKNRHITSATISLSETNRARVVLSIPLRSIGEHIFTVRLNPLPDEPTENNTRSFSVRVVKSTWNILLAAGTPSPDVGFIKRAIKSDSTFSLTTIIGKGDISSPEGTFPNNLSSFDSIIILDGGGPILTQEKANLIVQRVAQGCGLWLLGSSPVPNAASVIKKILPLEFSDNKSPTDKDVSIELTDEGITHILSYGVQNLTGEFKGEELPPLSSFLTISRVLPGGHILAYANLTNGQKTTVPAIVTGHYESGKIMVMPLSGMWRWQLMMDSAGREKRFYQTFVMGTLRWLMSEAERTPLTVTTDRRIYLSGQEVTLEARLFDNSYTPISGASIRVETDGNSEKVILTETIPSFYTGTLKVSAPGDYTYHAAAYLGGIHYADYTGHFTVEPFTIEMLDSSPDPEIMRTISERTGGMCVTPAGIDSLLTRLQKNTITEREEKDYALSKNSFLPAAIILLLAIEWTIRKRRGMI